MRMLWKPHNIYDSRVLWHLKGILFFTTKRYKVISFTPNLSFKKPLNLRSGNAIHACVCVFCAFHSVRMGNACTWCTIKKNNNKQKMEREKLVYFNSLVLLQIPCNDVNYERIKFSNESFSIESTERARKNNSMHITHPQFDRFV